MACGIRKDEAMKIAVVGAGGVGASFGAMLAEAGHEVTLLARGAHLEAIRANGLTVERAGAQATLQLAASDKASDLGIADVVLFAVKLWSTEEAGEAARPLVGPDTMVLVLQNGVDGIARLSPILGPDRVVGGVAQISAVIARPGHVVHRSPFARVIAGEPAGGMSERIRRFIEACNAAGLEARASENIQVDLWTKFVFIVGLSGATALMRAPVGPIREDDETRAFLLRLFEECTAVGRAEGIDLPADQGERVLSFASDLPATMRASMLDDLERGGRIEMPWLSGHVVALGERHGIDTPANRTVRLVLKLHADGPPKA
jgi:2-dehydropantoate 2-reductase